jgi:hypothetical protein
MICNSENSTFWQYYFAIVPSLQPEMSQVLEMCNYNSTITVNDLCDQTDCRNTLVQCGQYCNYRKCLAHFTITWWETNRGIWKSSFGSLFGFRFGFLKLKIFKCHGDLWVINMVINRRLTFYSFFISNRLCT